MDNTKYHKSGFVGYRNLHRGMNVVVDYQGRLIAGRLEGKPELRTYGETFSNSFGFKPKYGFGPERITSIDVVEILKRKKKR